MRKGLFPLTPFAVVVVVVAAAAAAD